VYAYQAKESLIKIEDSVVKQGFTIEDLTNRFTILLEEIRQRRVLLRKKAIQRIVLLNQAMMMWGNRLSLLLN
jgi:tmRNA-binding protein